MLYSKLAVAVAVCEPHDPTTEKSMQHKSMRANRALYRTANRIFGLYLMTNNNTFLMLRN
jgi:hypothetical protein